MFRVRFVFITHTNTHALICSFPPPRVQARVLYTIECLFPRIRFKKLVRLYIFEKKFWFFEFLKSLIFTNDNRNLKENTLS